MAQHASTLHRAIAIKQQVDLKGTRPKLVCFEFEQLSVDLMQGNE